MNNTQLDLSMGLPIMVFILTWLANRAEMNRHVDRIDGNLGSMRSEMAAIRNDHHKDLVALMSYMVPLHERMAKLSRRSKALSKKGRAVVAELGASRFVDCADRKRRDLLRSE